jgi:hypothetical protein
MVPTFKAVILITISEPNVETSKHCRMASSGLLHRVALVRTDVSEELRTSIIRVTRIAELGTTLAVTRYFFTACVSC